MNGYDSLYLKHESTKYFRTLRGKIYRIFSEDVNKTVDELKMYNPTYEHAGCFVFTKNGKYIENIIVKGAEHQSAPLTTLFLTASEAYSKEEHDFVLFHTHSKETKKDKTYRLQSDFYHCLPSKNDLVNHFERFRHRSVVIFTPYGYFQVLETRINPNEINIFDIRGINTDNASISKAIQKPEHVYGARLFLRTVLAEKGYIWRTRMYTNRDLVVKL